MAHDERRFIGRERERRLMSEALGALRDGQGECVLVAGEAGIGKTRLLAELSTLARAAGIGVAWGRASEAGGAPALWPWQQILRELVRVHGRARVIAAAGEMLPYVRRLLPELASEGPRSELETASARFLLVEAVTEVVCALRPLVLVLDDLHVADLATVELLEGAVPAMARAGILVVGSFRPEDAETSAELARVLWRVVRGATHLPLGRLAAGEVRALLEGVLGRPPSDQEADEVHRASEGSPLFVTEYGRLLRARGALPERMPPLIRYALEARIGRLDRDVREALATVSVLGREVDGPLAEALGAPVEALMSAEASGFVGGRTGGWVFSHILLRDALYGGLQEARRRALHARAAAAMKALGRSPVEVAHHLLLAHDEGDEGELVATLGGAVSELTRLLAFEDAARLVERALATRAFGEAARAELEVLIGGARIRGGLVDEGRATCVRAAEVARRLGDATLFARAAVAAGVDFEPGRVDEVLVGLLEEAARLELADKGLAARVRARLAAAMQPAREPAEPMRIAHEAIALARGEGDEAALMEVLAGATSALAYFEAPAVRRPLDEELLALAERAGNRLLAARARMRLVFDGIEAGRREEAERHLGAFEELAETLRRPRLSAHAPLVRAALSAATGDLAAADRYEAESRAIAGGAPWWTVCSSTYRQLRALSEDAAPEVLMALDGEMDEVAAQPFPLGREVGVAAQARLRAARGDRAAVMAALAQLEPGSWAETREPITMVMLVEPFLMAADEARVRALYEHLRPYAGRHVTSGVPFPACGGAYARSLAVLAAGLGEAEEARCFFEQAIAEARVFGARTYLARTLVELGEHLVATGAAAGTAAAVEASAACGVEAEALARAIGLSAVAERAAVLAAGRGARDERGEEGARARASAVTRAVTAEAALALRRVGELWELSHGAEIGRFRDARGFQILAALMARPGVEVAALVLDAGDEEGARAGRGAGIEALDERAIRAYRGRLEELREEVEEAERFGDDERASTKREAIEALVRELARGTGLGGRARKLAAPAERARINVQRRLKDAIGRVAAVMPAAGRKLEASVRTGAFCVYDPR